MAYPAPGARFQWRGGADESAARHACDQDDEGEPDEIEFEGGTPDWERRLTRREKLARGGSAALVVAVVAYLLLGGPTATVALLRALAPRPPEAVAAPAPPTVIAHPRANAGVPPSNSISSGSLSSPYALWSRASPPAGPKARPRWKRAPAARSAISHAPERMPRRAGIARQRNSDRRATSTQPTT